MTWPPDTHQDVEDDLDDAHGWASSLVGRHKLAEHAASHGALVWLTGRYYGPNILGTSTSATPTANRVAVFPVYFAQARSVDRLMCNVDTAGTAGHVARLGIWNADPDTGAPTTVLVDSGSFSVSTTGVKETTISQTLHGLVWFGITTQSGVFSGWNQTMLPATVGMTSTTFAMQNHLAYDTSAPTSALPTLPGSLTLQAAPGVVVPAVAVRAA
jgi:hypothetical protein